MDKPATIQEIVASLGERDPNSDALVFFREEEAEHVTRGELSDKVSSLSAGFSQQGIQKGDHIAVMAPNSADWIAVCLASIRLGAVFVPIDVQSSEKPLAHILNDCAPRLLFTTAEKKALIDELELSEKPTVVLLDGDDPDGEDNLEKYLVDTESEMSDIDENDIAALLYTSGTTGAPKGVPLTHKNLTFQIGALINAGLLQGNDRLIMPLPLHHVYPFMTGVLAPLTLDVPVVFPHALTGPELTRTLREGKITILVGVPRLYNALRNGITARIEQLGFPAGVVLTRLLRFSIWLRRTLHTRCGSIFLYPLRKKVGPHVRIAASGGAPLSDELAWFLEGLGWRVAIGYGLTETSPLLTLNPPGQARIGSVGKPIEGVDIRIDASVLEDKETTRGEFEEGEVLARGPNVFNGYRGLSEETEETFTEDGWFRTGDLGYLDDDGYLHLSGRLSTLIVTEGGENIQPDEVETAYEASPVISEIGILQKEGHLAAVVVPDMEAVESAEEDTLGRAVREAMGRVARNLPSFQRVTDYAITRQSLPRTRLGKIRRHILEERYDEAQQGRDKEEAGPVDIGDMTPDDQSLLENDKARKTWEWLSERFAERRLEPDSNLELDLGIDSLEWVNLTLELQERTGVTLDEKTISRVRTVRDLLEETIDAQTAETSSGKAPLEHPEEALDQDRQKWLTPLNNIQQHLAKRGFALNRVILKSCFQLQVEGAENIPTGESFFITPNHTSYLDPLAVAAALPYDILAATYWGGWTGAAFNSVFKRSVSRLAKAIPIDPDLGPMTSLALAAAVLQREKNLVWFPEGGRSMNGELQAFKPGLGVLLAHYPRLVVPTAIHGAYQALPVDRTLPRRHEIRVVFSEPVHSDKLKEEGEGDSKPARIVNALHQRMADLLTQS